MYVLYAVNILTSVLQIKHSVVDSSTNKGSIVRAKLGMFNRQTLPWHNKSGSVSDSVSVSFPVSDGIRLRPRPRGRRRRRIYIYVCGCARARVCFVCMCVYVCVRVAVRPCGCACVCVCMFCRCVFFHFKCCAVQNPLSDEHMITFPFSVSAFSFCSPRYKRRDHKCYSCKLS